MIACNATFKSLFWDAVATKHANLPDREEKYLPATLELTTWLNDVHCHDDIGLWFADESQVVRL